MLNLERLQALAAVHEHGSIRAAADALHVTPSALSQQIAKLQQETRSALTAPLGRGLRLTPVGLLLAERAKEILDLAARTEADLAAFETDVLGTVRVGSFTSASRVIVPRALTQLKREHPQLDLRFMTEESDALLQGVRDGALDLAVVDSWDGRPIDIPAGVTTEVLYHDVVDIALPNDHPLARRQRVSLGELWDIGWVVWRPGQTFTDWLVQAMRRFGVEPKIHYDVADFATQLEFVAAGLGAAVVPRLASVWVSDAVSMVEVEPDLGREILAISRQDSERPALRAVVDALRESFDLQSAQSEAQPQK